MSRETTTKDRPRQPPLRPARQALAQRDHDRALEAATQARAAGADPGACLDIELRGLMGLGRTARAYAAGTAGLARGETPTQAGYVALALAALDRGHPHEAERFADAALALVPDHARAIAVKYTAAVAHLPAEGLEDGLRARIFAPGTHAGHIRGIQRLAQERGVAYGAVARLLEQAQERWPDTPDLHAIQTLLQPEIQAESPQDDTRLPADIDPGKFTRPVIWLGEQPHGEDAPIVTDNTGTGDVLVHFNGIVRNFNRGPMLDSHVSMAGCSAIYLTDPTRLLFTTGIAGLGDDFDSAAQGVQRLIAGFGPRRSLTMMAGSAGGFGALHYGITLGADRVLCLSGVTTVDRAFLDTTGDRRARALLYRLEKAMPPHLARVRPRLEGCANPPRIDMVYGADNPEDRAQAEQLRGAPGVPLYPIAGLAQHSTQKFLCDAGLMPAVLAGDMTTLGRLCEPQPEEHP